MLPSILDDCWILPICVVQPLMRFNSECMVLGTWAAFPPTSNLPSLLFLHSVVKCSSRSQRHRKLNAATTELQQNDKYRVHVRTMSYITLPASTTRHKPGKSYMTCSTTRSLHKQCCCSANYIRLQWKKGAWLQTTFKWSVNCQHKWDL